MGLSYFCGILLILTPVLILVFIEMWMSETDVKSYYDPNYSVQCSFVYSCTLLERKEKPGVANPKVKKYI